MFFFFLSASPSSCGWLRWPSFQQMRLIISIFFFLCGDTWKPFYVVVFCTSPHWRPSPYSLFYEAAPTLGGQASCPLF
ncbi:hypothetical protein TRSC58_07492 [Trypanosoma rangeli SC58]|uniref:Uncharacterized protein n=1 Tax=Trypanosoma rangeli SC58 TaxID=429131 RepID=A0A061IRL2_TRYRA|nr:hypothetical protein TRSC58_07492 [Trypanosoma rangeli SC58]